MSKILFATTNEGKMKEVRHFFEGLDLELLSLNDLKDKISSDFEPEEDGKTFSENAILKAKAYGKKAGILTFADDSGLEVMALDGRPGVYSKRYSETTEERNLKLLKEMEGIEEDKRGARFVEAIALYDPSDKSLELTEGEMKGKIAFELKGNQGFGYDPIFINEFGKTNAEISAEEKNKISHRGKALLKLKEILVKKFKS